MKKLLLLFSLIALSVTMAHAQEFVVKSFEAKVTDLTAKLNPVLDLNGEPCALIRVALACKGCAFEGNIVGKPQAKLGEYLIYVPAGTKRLRIVHADFLPLTYDFNLKIEKNCTYELRLMLPQNRTAIPELNSQFLVLTVTPQSAIVFVNDLLQTTADGVLSKELAYGEHTYRVESPMHHPRRGTFTISEAGRTTLNVALEPAYGFLTVSSLPESGARVLVDGVEVGKTPYKSGRMASGNYQVQVLKEGYYPQMQPVTIADNQTSTLNLILKPTFSVVTLESPNPESEIWVSGKKYAIGRWSGRLDAGTYSVETRCKGHENALESITIEAEQPRTIRLQPQTPIYGVLKVNTTPVGATVKLDGKVIGETPLISNKVLVGNYTLEISKIGMTPTIRRVDITKEEPTDISMTLQSASAGASTRVDGRDAGKTSPSSSSVDYINIPDPNFKAYLIENFDQNKDGQISKSEAAVVDKIDVSSKRIASLAGIEYFVNLKELNCSYNKLTRLDVSNFTQLQVLNCTYNQLTCLDVSNLTQLTKLWCSDNPLTHLDVSNLPHLQDLWCSNNQLTSLDVSNNIQLKDLYVARNADLKTIYVYPDFRLKKGALLKDSKAKLVVKK